MDVTATRSAKPDLRRHQRYPTHSNIRIRRTDGSGREHDGVCTNYSVSGIGADVDAVFEVGEVIEFQFVDAADPGSNCYRARIIYRNLQHHYGVYLLRCC